MTITISDGFERIILWLQRYLASFDHRNRWFGMGRSLIALGPLTMLLTTPMRYFVVPVGPSPGTRCDADRGASILCLGNPDRHLELKRWVMVAILLSVVVGILPRVTAVLHWWVAYTLSVSITLPDGGEAIGLIMATLILPMAFADGRLWHWGRPKRRMRSVWVAISCAAWLALRVQLAYIYLDSGLAKLGVADWENGSAEYYIMRDPGFGVAGPLAPIARWITAQPLGSLLVTWSGIAIEVAIGVLILCSHRWRLVALVLDVMLHVSIILSIGLWSFALVMVGSAVVAANPCRSLIVPRRRTVKEGRRQDVIEERRQPRLEGINSSG